ncbi:hypothetical protein MAPG_05773 [Magnaporthiopsis poae ATCC 64411]|uniref:Uncharacterized protein n=1 Tax=Magnaporthiopsis poae (strain ATCC 64411 / 73-15) TaxID=644358 RepID=A0A0C4E0A4_MAGP6|nr:hypothetical protein MAPG_05773 [Magnaporthiopsis poae ATCC 64411]
MSVPMYASLASPPLALVGSPQKVDTSPSVPGSHKRAPEPALLQHASLEDGAKPAAAEADGLVVLGAIDGVGRDAIGVGQI